MCGITGVVGADISPKQLTKINDTMWHRGPDDGHHFVGDGVGLAARRLAIIDLAGGRQPLCNEDGSVWITYNGEVFNAPQLRTELEQRGHRFQTQTDTEAIVHGYEEWGVEIIGRLRGMFAFAIWDDRRKRLLIARDRFGMKPLYYAKSGRQFAFGSEVRPILTALPQLPRKPNHEALYRLFEIGYIPTPHSAFEHIYQLPAAHYLIHEQGDFSIHRYWQPVFSERGATNSRRSLGEYTEQFMEKLRDAVRAWKLADVPVGSLLSGGLDSSTLAALLTEISGTIHTFNIAFDAASHDESARAREVARAIGSEHHELGFGSAEFDKLPHIVRHLEAPQTSMTSIAIYLLYQACRDAGFKVILTGEGADELLGGYHWFDGDRRIRPMLKLPQFSRSLLAKLPRNISEAGRRVLARGDTNPLSRYHLWQQSSTYGDRHYLLNFGTQQRSPQYTNWHVPDNFSQLEPLHQFLYLDSQTRMVDFINFEVDRMSMAASVEARPPFLDHELWEFCVGLPADVKLSSAGNKLVLRQGAKSLIPDSITTRKKQGLATPHADWWRKTLPAWAEEAVHPTALRETNLFDIEAVQELREAHLEGYGNFSQMLTGILTTQLWWEAFITTQP